MFEKLRRWILGEFICRRCGKTFVLRSFGFGECFCRHCYDGSTDYQWLFFDNSYWLNRLLSRLGRQSIIGD